jgi:glycosyltransferase involved in cell wall biosynthesis
MPKNKSVIFVIGSIASGGAERNLVNLANRLVLDNHSVSIFVFEPKNNDMFYDVNKNIQIFYPLGLRIFSKIRILKIIDLIISLAILQIKIKNCTSISFLSVPNLVNIFASQLSRCKIIISERNDPKFSQLLKKHKLFFGKVYKYAPILIVQRHVFLEWFKENFKIECSVIPNPMPSLDFGKRHSDREKIISLIGSHKYQNGIDIFIGSIRLLKETGKLSGWKFEIIGANGPETDNIKKQIKSENLNDDIIIINPKKDILNYIKTIACVCVTSRYEGMSNVILEAVACGTPVITNKSVNPEIVQQRINGIIVSENVISNYYAALEEFITDANLRDNVTNNVNTTGLDKFSQRDVYRLWVKLIE